LFDEVPCYITVLDRDFKLVAANRRFKEDFGDDIGSNCYEVCKDRQQPCEECPVAKTFQDGKPHQAEMVVTPKAGVKYNVLVWTAPLRNSEGEITQVMEMITDITQMRQLQDHLSSLGLLIGSISHSIKGLLTGLDGGMYLLNSGFAKENTEQIEEGWDVVKLMIGRIRNMVLNILYYAKERDLNWERVNVLDFVQEVALTIALKVQEHQIEFESDFDPSLGEFEVDTGVVRSALVNILENALEACLEDNAKASHKISFSTGHDEEHIIFNVRDDGAGMDRETKEKMFTLFFSSKGHRGTGLGLFISQQIIRQHGGTICVESTPEQGTHLQVKIPKKPPESIRNQTAEKA
jgi:PAS domain S-box-containing protein